jgi:hypothetical protein
VSASAAAVSKAVALSPMSFAARGERERLLVLADHERGGNTDNREHRGRR